MPPPQPAAPRNQKWLNLSDLPFQQAGHQTVKPQAKPRPRTHPANRQSSAPVQNEHGNVGLLRSESHPQAEFVCAPRCRVRDDAINTHPGQHHERTGENKSTSVPSNRGIDSFIVQERRSSVRNSLHRHPFVQRANQDSGAGATILNGSRVSSRGSFEMWWQHGAS